MTLGLLAFTILAFVVLLDRLDRRARQERTGLEDRADAERTAHRLEVLGLLQRIQAPELAVVEHLQQTEENGTHPPTDAQLAEQQEMAAVIARIEQVENEGF